MILASRSFDSSSSKRIPLTVPAVPTGINTGVSIFPRRVVNTPTRASPLWDSMSKRKALVIKVLLGHGQNHLAVAGGCKRSAPVESEPVGFAPTRYREAV